MPQFHCDQALQRDLIIDLIDVLGSEYYLPIATGLEHRNNIMYWTDKIRVDAGNVKTFHGKNFLVGRLAYLLGECKLKLELNSKFF